MRWFTLLVLFAMALSSWADSSARPPCNAHNRGAVWPTAREGDNRQPAQVCTLNVWKYRWQTVTVSVSDLVKKSRHAAPSEVAPATARDAAAETSGGPSDASFDRPR